MDYMNGKLRSILSKVHNPEKCICTIQEYRIGMSVLELEVYQNENNPPIMLIFNSVKYYEGPTSWLGVQFFIDSADNTRKLLDWIAKCRGIATTSMYLENTHLFVVGEPIPKVKIVASGVGLG